MKNSVSIGLSIVFFVTIIKTKISEMFTERSYFSNIHKHQKVDLSENIISKILNTIRSKSRNISEKQPEVNKTIGGRLFDRYSVFVYSIWTLFSNTYTYVRWTRWSWTWWWRWIQVWCTLRPTSQDRKRDSFRNFLILSGRWRWWTSRWSWTSLRKISP